MDINELKKLTDEYLETLYDDEDKYKIYTPEQEFESIRIYKFIEWLQENQKGENNT